MSSLIGRANDFNITYLSSEDGLSQNEVTGILQDKNGFMWFGTRGGLNRYDGYEFIQHKSRIGEENHLSNPSIEALFEDSKGNIWIGTKSGGLNRFDPKTETFSHITSFGKNKQTIFGDRVISFDETKDGRLLVGTWSAGLYVLDSKNDTLFHILENRQVNDILVDGEKWAWIATNRNFFRLNLKDLSVENVDLGKHLNYTHCINDSANNVVWIAGWNCGLVALDKNSLQYTRYLVNQEDKNLLSVQNNTYRVFLDSQDRVWVGTWNGGLWLFNKNSKVFTKVEIKPVQMGSQNTDFDIILSLNEDSDQNIWIGTDSGGIVRIGGKQSFGVVSVTRNPDCGLKNFHISAFWKSPDGVLYLGTRGGGLYKTYDNQHFELVPFSKSSPESNIIRHIINVSPDVLWIGTAGNIYELNLKEEKEELKRLKHRVIAGIGKFTSYMPLDSGILIGTQQNGLFLFPDYFKKPNEYINIRHYNNSVLKNDRITFLNKDSDGNIWVGTYKGVYFYDPLKQKISTAEFVENEKLSSDIIHCWHQSNDSIFWLGTPSGLNKLTRKNTGKFEIKRYYSEDGLPDDFVHGIQSATSSEIWISTNSGLAKLELSSNKIISFDKTDGLQGMSFSEEKGYLAPDSTLYFGGNMGYNFFKQNEISFNQKVPQVVFTRFKVFNEEISAAEEVKGKVLFEKPLNSQPLIQLSHKEKEFTFEYAALNFNAPERNQYAYKLIGYDDDWVQAGAKRSVTYLNIEPGEYEFVVRGSNNNNVWNNTGASIFIKIKPAPWKTWYAIVLYACLVISIVLLIRRNAIRQVHLANNLKVEKLKHDQNKKLSEMRMRFFTNISHEFRTPLTLIMAPLKDLLSRKDYYQLSDEAHHKITIAQSNSVRLLKLITQLLDFRKVESGNQKLKACLTNVTEFLTEVCHPFTELASINNIQFELVANLKNQELWLDRDKVEIIINNIISNAFKHVPEGGKIKVALHETEENICLSVSDNGPGIPANVVDKIFERFYMDENESGRGSSGIGLALTKSLVELHKGTIEVTSEAFKKTEFKIFFKKGEEHLNPDEMHNIERAKKTYINEEQIVTFPQNLKLTPANKSDDTILIVEDNPEINGYLYNLLAPLYNVETALDGEQGYALALEIMPDLILSDVMMPNMDGFEFCEKLRNNSDTSTIPFIFLTAKSKEQFRLLGTKLGADDFISKPFDPNLLLEKVKKLLEIRKKLQAKYAKSVKLEPSDVEITSGDEIFLQEVIKLIEKNLQNNKFSSEVLATGMNMSRSTFYRKLKGLTGYSIAEFIRIIRLKRAAQLLADKERTITEIIYEVGFDDPKHFRAKFQKQFGCTPSEYRKNL